MGLPGGSDGKESTCSVRDLGLIPGSGRFPGEGHGNPLQYSGESHGQRSLASDPSLGLYRVGQLRTDADTRFGHAPSPTRAST